MTDVERSTRKGNRYLCIGMALAALSVAIMCSACYSGRQDCICSVLTYEEGKHEIDDRLRMICDCNTSGTFILVNVTCEHGVRVQLRVYPDENIYVGKRCR